MKEWKEFENNEISHSMAHYLMAIQELHKRQGYARVTDVAKELEITAGSASVSIKKLRADGWVEEDHNRFIRLSPEGERLAHEIHINNRLFVAFLSELLHVSEAQAQIDACKIEHLLSSETREKMLRFMTYIHEDNKVVKNFRHGWNDYHFDCHGPEDCLVCEDGETCAIHEKLTHLMDQPKG